MGYRVKYGGKDGKTVELVESPDLVAIRTKGNKELENVSMSRESRELVDDTTEVAAFPEAGVTVRRVAPGSGDLESTTNRRDETRAALKQEDEIRFAGRVLEDKDSGEVTLYTENFFVKFKDGTSEAEGQAILDKYKLQIKSKLPFAPNSYFVQAAEGTGLEVFNIAETLLKEPSVEFCHPELIQERRFKGVHALQWHLAPTRINDTPVEQHVNIEKAWQITRGKGVTIAVIDDGIDTEHPEFAGRVVHPFDASRNVNDPRPVMDDDNHGTPCAGMACASGLEDGASGTAPEAFLLPIRLRSGLGSLAEANAFAWAADHGADVISCSWGPTDGKWWDPSDTAHLGQTPLPDSTRLALEYALNKGRQGKGCVILFAAGNGNEDTANDGYCSYPGVIAVAACNDSGVRSVYSDYGKAVWVSFPSGDYAYKPFRHPAPISQGLRTTDRLHAGGYTPTGYIDNFGGTSGACPGMAGVVALMLAANPALTAKEVKEIVGRSCVRIDEADGEYDASGHSVYYGYGRIDAGLAVANARRKQATSSGTPVNGTTPLPAVASAQAGKPGAAAVDAGKPASAAASAGKQAISIDGIVKFSAIGEVNLEPGVIAGNFRPAKKVIGFSFRLLNGTSNLRLRYKANVPGIGIVQNTREGEYVGATSGRQRLIGFALELMGTAAKRYDLEYTAQLQGQTEPVRAKNGAFCGTDEKTGKTIQAISVVLRERKK
jgi:subtilisin family serine protease